MNAQEMWDLFTQDDQDLKSADWEAWAFGDDPDALAGLVLQGIKTGTASAYDLYALEGENLPKAGEYSVILDSGDRAVCVIRTTKVYVISFCDVSEAHAYKEGEGDRSLQYWRKVHRKFFTACLNEAGLQFDEKMKVVCEEFEVVYRP